MTAHKHAELIKAKADNMELVLFIIVGDKWRPTGCHDNRFINIASHYEYFLCLPKHKEACLHWLNGGEIEFNSELSDGWEEYGPIKTWGLGSVFMQDDYQLRIKPRKEKRWIAVKRKDKTEVYVLNFNSLDEAIDTLNEKYWQFIEIEVEV